MAGISSYYISGDFLLPNNPHKIHEFSRCLSLPIPYSKRFISVIKM